MTKTLSKAIAAFSLGALVLLAGACQKEAEKPQLGSLKAAFGSDEYSVEPGGTISLAFVVSGHENADVAVSAKASSDRASVEVKNPLMYQGEVLFTAPAVSAGETVTVTLTAVDEANSRKVEATTAVKVGASEALEIAFSSEYKSMACRPGGSFAIPFAIKGVGLAKISSPQLAVTPSSWGGKCELASDGLSGKIVLTAPSALTESVKVELSVKDDYSREAKATLDIAIAAVTETAGASNSYIVKPGSTLTIKAVEGNSADKVDFDNAKLLWQTELGMVKSVSAAPGEGALVVSLNPGLSGNAVVAALKDGVIVWSWHLWVCDYDPDADPFVWKSAAGNTFTFMDRNLGALSSEKYSDKALGYMYQYGRKDPFVCADGVHSSALIKMYDMDGQRVYDDAKERPVYDDRTSTNLQLAINNPMTFYSALKAHGLLSTGLRTRLTFRAMTSGAASPTSRPSTIRALRDGWYLRPARHGASVRNTARRAVLPPTASMIRLTLGISSMRTRIASASVTSRLTARSTGSRSTETVIRTPECLNV